MAMWPKRRKVSSGFYEHTIHDPFTNGAEEFGFVQKFPNPLLLATGTGYIPALPVGIHQPPQVYANLAVPNVDAISGFAAGNLIFQPLLNNDLTPVE